MTIPAVEVEQLVCTFGARRALDGVDLRVESGEAVGLLGPNGSGKTTLFRVLATLLRPTGGAARILGHDAASAAHVVRRHIGVVFQNPSLDKKLTAAENLIHQGQLYGLSGAALRRRVDELLERLRLADRRNELIESFSGGMARRVEIAKGLLHRPEVLLLDEPSTGLDPGARRDTWDLLDELRRAGRITLCFTTHLMDEAERAGRLLILDRGRVVAGGAPEQLKSSVGGDVLRIDAADTEALCGDIVARFGGAASVLDGAVRIERPAAHTFVPELIEAFAGRIRAVSVSKPTLEDVFIHATGHGLYEEGAPRP